MRDIKRSAHRLPALRFFSPLSTLHSPRVAILVAFSFLAPVSYGQNFSKPLIAGRVMAGEYGHWVVQAQGPILGNGTVETATVTSGPLTLSDGSGWQPLTVGTPVYVDDGSASEVITPTAVDCSSGGAWCRFSAVYHLPHNGRFRVRSATAGIDEAINAAPVGGMVELPAGALTLYAPVIITKALRLNGSGEEGTVLTQSTIGVDGLQIGSATLAPSDVAIDNLEIVGPYASPTAASSGVGVHCVNCVRLKPQNITAQQWGTGLFFDSALGHAFTNDVVDSHFIQNYVGVHIQGGSANRLTFVGDTVDSNSYGVWDDGGWVHTWVGNDIESNSIWGYYQNDTTPGSYSQHNVDLYGNYFEGNGSNTSGQGDIFLGANAASGAGCNECLVQGNIFNASTGGNVTAIDLGNFQGNLEGNVYSGYGTGKQVLSGSDPTHGYTWALSLGDTGTGTPGTISRVDTNGGLTLGGNDNSLTLHDTVVESPTKRVIIRGQQGGNQASNFATLDLDAQSTANQSTFLTFSNQLTPLWSIQPDYFAQNVHDLCLVNDDTTGQCQVYFNGGHWQFANGIGAVPHVPAGDFSFQQIANGDTGILMLRNSDSSPSGFLLDLVNQANTQHLFSVNATGTLVNGSINTGGSVNAGSLTQNGVRVLTPADLPLSGQSGSILGQSYTAGQCAGSAVTITGALTGMVAAASPETDPGSGFVWEAFISAANTVVVRLCNTNGTTATAAAAVYDVRVMR